MSRRTPRSKDAAPVVAQRDVLLAAGRRRGVRRVLAPRLTANWGAPRAAPAGRGRARHPSLLLKHGTLDGVPDAWGHPPEAEIAPTFREVARMRGEDDEAELDVFNRNQKDALKPWLDDREGARPSC
jgi:hypothetical protein